MFLSSQTYSRIITASILGSDERHWFRFILFHGFLPLTTSSFQLLVRHAMLCSSSFSGFVQLGLSGKNHKLSMFPRDLLHSVFQILICICSMSRTFARIQCNERKCEPCFALLIRRFPLHCDDEGRCKISLVLP